MLPTLVKKKSKFISCGLERIVGVAESGTKRGRFKGRLKHQRRHKQYPTTEGEARINQRQCGERKNSERKKKITGEKNITKTGPERGKGKYDQELRVTLLLLTRMARHRKARFKFE